MESRKKGKEQREDWSEFQFSNSVPKKTGEGHERKMHGALQGLLISVLHEDERRRDGCRHELRVLPTEVRDVRDVRDEHRHEEERERTEQRDVRGELRELPTDDHVHVHVHEIQYGQEQEGELHEHDHEREPMGGEEGLPMQVEHELRVQLQWEPNLVC